MATYTRILAHTNQSQQSTQKHKITPTIISKTTKQKTNLHRQEANQNSKAANSRKALDKETRQKCQILQNSVSYQPQTPRLHQTPKTTKPTSVKCQISQTQPEQPGNKIKTANSKFQEVHPSQEIHTHTQITLKPCLTLTQHSKSTLKTPKPTQPTNPQKPSQLINPNQAKQDQTNKSNKFQKRPL